MTYKDLLAYPSFRVFRRVAATAVSAGLIAFIAKVGVSPDTIVDNLLLLQAEDIVQILKLSLGTALVMGLDKLNRELPNLTK